MSDQRARLQTTFMGAATNTHSPVSVQLMNSIRLRGIIVAEDAYCLLVVDQGAVALVYKHAVGSVMPLTALDLTTAPATPA